MVPPPSNSLYLQDKAKNGATEAALGPACDSINRSNQHHTTEHPHLQGNTSTEQYTVFSFGTTNRHQLDRLYRLFSNTGCHTTPTTIFLSFATNANTANKVDLRTLIQPSRLHFKNNKTPNTNKNQQTTTYKPKIFLLSILTWIIILFHSTSTPIDLEPRSSALASLQPSRTSQPTRSTEAPNSQPVASPLHVSLHRIKRIATLCNTLASLQIATPISVTSLTAHNWFLTTSTLPRILPVDVPSRAAPVQLKN